MSHKLPYTKPFSVKGIKICQLLKQALSDAFGTFHIDWKIQKYPEGASTYYLRNTSGLFDPLPPFYAGHTT